MPDRDKTPQELLAEFEELQKQLDEELASLGLPGPEDAEAMPDASWAGYPEILQIAGSADDADLTSALEAAFARGLDPNETSRWGETLAGVLWNRGRMEALALARAAGADLTEFGFGPLHEAVAFGDLAEVADQAARGGLEARDAAGRTAFLLACRLGQHDKARLLLASTPPPAQLTEPDGEGPVHMAARGTSLATLDWLLAEGFAVDPRDRFGGTPLLIAAGAGDLAVVERLLAAGADPMAEQNLTAANRARVPSGVLGKAARAIAGLTERMPGMMQMSDTMTTPADSAGSAEVAGVLVRAGAPFAAIESELRPELTGAALIASQEITSAQFAAGRSRRFGTCNPEPAPEPFWRDQIRTGASGYAGGRQRFLEGDAQCEGPAVWSFDRFGQSGTLLADGRWVLVGGEHEDHYDPDFCIYNDVTVLDGRGGVAHYLYPRAVFPPSDFHSATLLGDEIVLIGCLGYAEDRREGETPVHRLSLGDFSIRAVPTRGDNPGWIHRHRAVPEGGRIVVSGGKVEPGYRDLEGRWALDLETWRWRRLEG